MIGILKSAVLLGKDQPGFDPESVKWIMQSYHERNNITCPSSVTNGFYMPGSIGEGTDISDSLKKQITELQAPNKGSSALPSKYYHTIGAAYASCSLFRAGSPKFIAKKIQSVGVNSYRMIRICEKNNFGDYSLYSKLSDNEIPQIINKITKIKNEDELGKVFETCGEQEADNFCNVMFLGGGEFVEIGDPEIIKEKFYNIIHNEHAKQIFFKSVLNPDDCGSVQMTDKNIKKLEAVANSEGKYCGDIPKEKCDKALDVLKTWHIDFLWSHEQHMKGVEFASKHCKKEKDFLTKGLEAKSCLAISNTSGDASSDSEIKKGSN